MLFGQSPTASQPCLDEQLKRQVWGQLKELYDLKVITLAQYEAEIAKLNAAIVEKDSIFHDQLMSEQKKTEAAMVERDVFRQKAEFYEASLKTVTKKRSKWCGFLKFITFGISGCR